MAGYLADLAQGSMSRDPAVVRDVTLGQIRSLYTRRRESASGGAVGPSQVMPYDEVLRRTFRLRGHSDAEVEALVLKHAPPPPARARRRAAARQSR